MAEIKVEHELTLSREEVADWLVDLADAIRDGGTAELPLSGPVVTVPLGDDVDVEIEVEIDGDEVELELELSWSLGRKGDAASGTAPKEDEDAAEDPAPAAAPAAAPPKAAPAKKPKASAGATSEG
jgi:amphi-Trp domain-containing protein